MKSVHVGHDVADLSGEAEQDSGASDIVASSRPLLEDAEPPIDAALHRWSDFRPALPRLALSDGKAVLRRPGSRRAAAPAECPGSFRELIQMLGVAGGYEGLAKLLDEMDFAGVTKNRIYAATLARLPESLHVCHRIDDDAARVVFKDFLLSEEFQDRIIQNVLNAYAERRRLLFVHIPKCAGTDLSADLGEKFPTLRQTLMYPGDTDKKTLFAELAKLSVALNRSDQVFVCGHNTLKWYLDKDLVRFDDDVFTIARDPFLIVVSYVNYIVTAMLDEEGDRRDRRRFWAALGELPPTHPLSDELKRELALRVLYTPALIEPNYICRYLGDGDYDRAVDAIARSGVEVVDFNRYEEWRTSKWGLPRSARRHQSLPFLSAETLEPTHRDYIEGLTQDDRKLYDVFLRAWAHGAGPSFLGADILEHL